MKTENNHKQALMEVYRLLNDHPGRPDVMKIKELKEICETALKVEEQVLISVPLPNGSPKHNLVSVNCTWIGDTLAKLEFVPVVNPNLQKPGLPNMRPWGGNPAPWAGGESVFVTLRNGENRYGKVRDFQFSWKHERPNDVVAYRLDYPDVPTIQTRDDLQP